MTACPIRYGALFDSFEHADIYIRRHSTYLTNRFSHDTNNATNRVYFCASAVAQYNSISNASFAKIHEWMAQRAVNASPEECCAAVQLKKLPNVHSLIRAKQLNRDGVAKAFYAQHGPLTRPVLNMSSSPPADLRTLPPPADGTIWACTLFIPCKCTGTF